MEAEKYSRAANCILARQNSRCDYWFHRWYDVCCDTFRDVWRLDHHELGLDPRSSGVGPILCGPRNDSFCRGDFPIYVRSDLAKQDGSRSRRWADLDLQISLLTEHELTKIAALLADLAGRMGVKTAELPEYEEIKHDVVPEAVLDKMQTLDR
jgi:hypothetical protein